MNIVKFPLMMRAALSWPTRFASRISYDARCECRICNRRIQRFLPYRAGSAVIPDLVRKFSIVGSDVKNFECPACGCHDRERHLVMYLVASGMLQKMAGNRILHFAPEKNIQKCIQGVEPKEYVQGDLNPTEPEVRRVDLQNIPFSDGYFDFVIVNHVLEHVENDLTALSEIYRVVRLGGYAVLQTPYSATLDVTFEDLSIKSEEARLQAYGQEDHRRLYGRDIFDRIETSGFKSRVKMHSELLPDYDPTKYGINSDEPFFLFQKEQ